MSRTRTKPWCLLILTALVSGSWGCNLPAAYGNPGQARQALLTFFDLLSRANYVQAVGLFGGDYAQLEAYGPGLDPADRAGLWQNACETSGMQCLPVATADYIGSDGDIYTFMVQFRKPDGNVFALAPCCGEPGFLEPPMAKFVYRVARTGQGRYVVLDLPVYVP